MADADVDELIRTIHRLVVEDTDGWSPVRLPNISSGVRRLIEPLAVNRDIPARLAPGPSAEDQRPLIRRGMTALVEECATNLEADGQRPGGRESAILSMSVNGAYAEQAMPRLLQKLLPEGGAEQLGHAPEPPMVGDGAAARSLAVSISARTGRGEGDVLRTLAGAGWGGAGPVAADMLVRAAMGSTALSPKDQEAVTELVAGRLEKAFADRGPGRDEWDARGERRDSIDRGADAVEVASVTAEQEVQRCRARAGASVAHILDPQLSPTPGSQGANAPQTAEQPARPAGPRGAGPPERNER